MSKIKVSSYKFRKLHGIQLNEKIACYLHPLGLVPMMDTKYVIPFN